LAEGEVAWHAVRRRARAVRRRGRPRDDGSRGIRRLDCAANPLRNSLYQNLRLANPLPAKSLLEGSLFLFLEVQRLSKEAQYRCHDPVSTMNIGHHLECRTCTRC